MKEIDPGVKTSLFFSAILEEYKIRLDAVEKNRARALGMMPVFAFTALLFGWYFLTYVVGGALGPKVVAFVALAAFVAGTVFLLFTASRKGLVRADVNALLKAAKLDESGASEAMADIYIDRVNDLDHLVDSQERHFRTGSWLEFGYAMLAVLAMLLQGVIG
jgi:hypothetical protein